MTAYVDFTPPPPPSEPEIVLNDQGDIVAAVEKGRQGAHVAFMAAQLARGQGTAHEAAGHGVVIALKIVERPAAPVGRVHPRHHKAPAPKLRPRALHPLRRVREVDDPAGFSHHRPSSVKNLSAGVAVGLW